MLRLLTQKRFLIGTVAFLVVVLAVGMVFVNRSPRAAGASTLGAAAAQSGRYFGTSIATGNLGISQYTNVLNTQFTAVTPENEMKWDTTEPSNGSFNFGPGDQIVSYAQAHNMKVRGHTLVWHNQLPSWVQNLSGSSTVLSAMDNHITTEMTHYKGQIWYWDVVNEAFNDDGTRRSDVFQNQIGNNYIADAFTAARAADPNAKLCYNDYNIEGENAKSNAVFSMVQSFKASGVPIDCVGFQSHLIVGQVPSDFQANLQRFANLGVDVQLTELDIRMPTPASTANLNQQATDYGNVVKACMSVSRCTDMTVWGVDDGHSWVPGTFPGQGAALLFDANYQPKPAFYSALQALNNGVSVPTPTNTPSSGMTPTSTPITTGGNLLTNGGAESGTTGWSVFGSGTLTAESNVVHSGNTALLLTGRTAAWNGISQDVTSKLTNGATYTTTVWVRSQTNSPSAQVTLAVTANGSTSYLHLAGPTTVNTSGWTLVSGTATVSWSGSLTSAIWYTETTSGTDSFYLDDASFSSGSQPPPTATPAPTNTPTSGNTPTPTPTVVGSTPTPTPTTTSGGNGVTASGVVASNSPYFGEEDVKFSSTAPITAMTVTITVQKTTGISYGGSYTTFGGVTVTHVDNGSTVVYTFTLTGSLPPGANTAAAQFSGTGTAHSTSGDTWSITTTSNGVTNTQSGHF